MLYATFIKKTFIEIVLNFYDTKIIIEAHSNYC